MKNQTRGGCSIRDQHGHGSQGMTLRDGREFWEMAVPVPGLARQRAGYSGRVKAITPMATMSAANTTKNPKSKLSGK